MLMPCCHTGMVYKPLKPPLLAPLPEPVLAQFLAVIQVDPNGTDETGASIRSRIKPVPLGDSSQVTIGQYAIAPAASSVTVSAGALGDKAEVLGAVALILGESPAILATGPPSTAS